MKKFLYIISIIFICLFGVIVSHTWESSPLLELNNLLVKLFPSSFLDGFEKTLIKEDRWKLLLEGILITIEISLTSAFIGVILGFILCFMRLSKNNFFNLFSLCYIRALQGVPILIVLMGFYYAIFANMNIDPVLVAIIAYSLNFAAFSAEIIRAGILSIDKGQSEAALALGLSKTIAFIKVILPQAARHFLPVMRGEFVSLIKGTSVVGYIAIKDLTKMSDLIRGYTYDPFFPFILTAIVYLILTFLLASLIDIIQKKFEPKHV